MARKLGIANASWTIPGRMRVLIADDHTMVRNTAELVRCALRRGLLD